MTPEEIALRTAELEQKKREQDAANGPAGTVGSVLSMLSSIGGAIPTLLPQPEKGALKAAQAGRGAGATIARQTASEAGRRVVGASTAQPTSGRGGALREGLRSAERITERGAAQASTIGAQESLAATQMLRQGTMARRGAGMRFGAGIGQGLAGIAGMMAAAKDQGPVQPGETEAGVDLSSGMVDPVTGIPTAPKAFQLSSGLEDPPDTQQLGRPLPGLQNTEPGVRMPGADIGDARSAYPLEAPFPISSKPMLDPAGRYGPPQAGEVGQSLAQPRTSPRGQGPSPGSADFQGPSGGGQGALASPVQQLQEATAKKAQASAEYAASASTAGEGFVYDPQWGVISTQLTDRDLTEEQARGMLELLGAPPSVVDVMVSNAVNGQRHYDLEKAVKANLLRQKARDAGAFAGEGPNRK